MPTRPPTLPGPAPQRSYDQERYRSLPTRRLYATARWRALRRAQLAAEPLCAFCLQAGIATAATVCDHVAPHRGDPARFFNSPMQSLCASCHSSLKQRQEARQAPEGGRGGQIPAHLAPAHRSAKTREAPQDRRKFFS